MGEGWICIADEAISEAGLKVEKSGNITNLKLAGPQMKVGQDALWVITDLNEGKTPKKAPVKFSPVEDVAEKSRRKTQAHLQKELLAAHLSSNLREMKLYHAQ